MTDNVIPFPASTPTFRAGFHEIKVFESDEHPGDIAVVVVCAAESDALRSLIAAISCA